MFPTWICRPYPGVEQSAFAKLETNITYCFRYVLYITGHNAHLAHMTQPTHGESESESQRVSGQEVVGGG
jgi:hypothetical protein